MPRRLRLLRLETRLVPSTVAWDGGGADNKWTTAANWVGDIAPRANDDLVFPAGAARLANVNDFAAGTIFNRLTVSGPNYVLTGNSLGVVAGVLGSLPAGTPASAAPVIGTDIVFPGNTLASIATSAADGELIIAGNVTLGGLKLSINSSAPVRITGAIRGAGGIDTNGAVTFSGANTYTGVTSVVGTLELKNGGTLGASGANNETTIGAGDSTLRLTGAGVATADAITLVSSAPRFFPATTSRVIVTPNTTATLSGPITLGGNSEIHVPFILGEGSTLTVTSGIGQSTSLFSAIDLVAPSNSFLGVPGTFILAPTAVNTFTGQMRIGSFTGATQGGNVRAQIDGRQTGPISVTDGGLLGGSGTVRVVGVLGGDLIGAVGAFTVGNLILSGPNNGFGSGGRLDVVDVTAPGGVATADRVAVRGTVTVANAALAVNFPNGLPATPTTTLVIVDNDGADAVVGTFLNLPEGAVAATANGFPVRITYRGGDGNDIALSTAPLASARRFAVAAGPGSAPRVNVYDGTGFLLRTISPYDDAFRGGVRVATGDVTGDGVADVVTAPGPGGGPDIRIFDGVTGALVRRFDAYDPRFRGGVFVAVGDFNADGRAEVVTAPDAGGGPVVRTFNGTTGTMLGQFLAYSASFTGGVSVAAEDLTGGGAAFIITGAGPGGGPHVRVFNAAGRPGGEFFAYDASYRGGVYVAATPGRFVSGPPSGGVNGGILPPIVSLPGSIIVGPRGGGQAVRVFNGASGVPTAVFSPYSGFAGGVTVAAEDVDADGVFDIVTGAGKGGGPNVKAFDLTGTTTTRNFLAFDPAFLGGVFVG